MWLSVVGTNRCVVWSGGVWCGVLERSGGVAFAANDMCVCVEVVVLSIVLRCFVVWWIDAHGSLASLAGLSALCVTGAGIHLFHHKWGCVDSPTFPNDAKEQIWRRVAPPGVEAEHQLRIVPYVEGRELQLQQAAAAAAAAAADDDNNTADCAATIDGVRYLYVNDCRMLFCTPKVAPHSPVWPVLRPRTRP